MAKAKLSSEEKVRFKRHLSVPEIGEAGQLRLKESAVLVAGAGGLGSASSLYLAAAGVGRIGILDFDEVELSNLQRQILHDMNSLGDAKVESAKRRLLALNPALKIEAYRVRLVKENCSAILQDYPVVIDATDNIETRYLLNEQCVEAGKTFIYGAVFRFFGQMSVFDASKGACFRCVFQRSSADEETRFGQEPGVASPLPGVIGALQAIEAIKQILGVGEPAVGRMILFDALDMHFQEVLTRKDPACPVCGGK